MIQDDNALAHKSRKTKEVMKRMGLKDVGQPPRSPEFEAMELTWGWQTQEVYRETLAYTTEEELRGAISEAWTKFCGNKERRERLFSHVDSLIYIAAAKYGLVGGRE